MKNFDPNERLLRFIKLENSTNNGMNCAPFKEEFIDANAVNLSLDETIYRIFDVDKFKKTLTDKKLCLVRPHKWQDPFENFILNSVGQLDDGTLVGFDNIRNKYYGQCWTLRKECDGLWRNYKGTASSAIKVKTTVRKLMNELYDLTNNFHQLCYFIGKVDYVSDDVIEDYFKNEVDILNFQSGIEFAQTLLIKRLSFTYEEEVRIIFNSPSTDEIDLVTVKNPWDKSDLFFVNIDPNVLFEVIEIDPWLTTVEFDKLKLELTALGFNGNITRSSLYDRPFFVTKIKR